MKTYDPSCLDLAQLFLEDEPDLMPKASELAELIQSTIEDFISYERNRVKDEPR